MYTPLKLFQYLYRLVCFGVCAVVSLGNCIFVEYYLCAVFVYIAVVFVCIL